jgi:hypothetical protein
MALRLAPVVGGVGAGIAGGLAQETIARSPDVGAPFMVMAFLGVVTIAGVGVAAASQDEALAQLGQGVATGGAALLSQHIALMAASGGV